MKKNISPDIITPTKFLFLKELLKKQSFLKMIVSTSSMEPILRVGSEIFVQPIDNDNELRELQIYIYFDNNMLVCHYLQSINKFFTSDGETVYHFRGLKNKHEDFPIKRSQILGKVVNKKLNFYYIIKIILQQFHW